ncbi:MULTISPECIES: hypothetical protein [unclassified Burkholderia]|uniref:hypothetical protein n=1 Tax=unclassified Burkholderia TaxID=2613784 RepID=UPI00163A9375|nr:MULTISPECIES: hypothetical protein [unclassified Burkholderia]
MKNFQKTVRMQRGLIEVPDELVSLHVFTPSLRDLRILILSDDIASNTEFFSG